MTQPKPSTASTCGLGCLDATRTASSMSFASMIETLPIVLRMSEGAPSAVWIAPVRFDPEPDRGVAEVFG